jgi:poly(hydroxyalkanoate) depolymerase family esterase
MLNTMLNAWSSFAAFTPAPASSQAAGNFIADRYDNDAGSLQYKLFVPASYTGAPMPLIVMLHGGGQDADDFALGTGMNELAEQFGCLVAYPQQSAHANWSKCWNWFDETNQRSSMEAALIAGVTRKVLADYAIDRARVFVAGLSAGGAMAVIVGQTYPDLFRAVCCHSGLAHGSASDHYGAMLAMRDGADPQALTGADTLTSVPTIVFHGDLDFTVHPKNGLGVVQQSIDSYTGRLRHKRACLATLKETGETAGRKFTRVVHKGMAGRIVAEQWTVHGTGHAWSGGSRRGSYTDANGPDASREMLRFFLLH